MKADAFLHSLSGLQGDSEALSEWYSDNLPLLINHRIAPLLSREMLKLSPDEKTGKQAEEIILEAKGRHAVYSDALGKIAEVLGNSTIQYVIFKGCSMWEFYEKPWVRQQEDIDIVIQPGTSAETVQLLTGIGYSSDSSVKTSKHISLVHPQAGIPDIEIHMNINPPGRGPAMGTDLFSKKVTISLGRYEIPVLPFRERLLAMIIHAANHRIVLRMQWLYEIAMMLTAEENTEFLLSARAQLKRMIKGVLWYTAAASGSEKASMLERQIPDSFLFMPLLRRIIPAEKLLANPVIYSRIRRYLYILNLVRNPLDIVRILKSA